MSPRKMAVRAAYGAALSTMSRWRDFERSYPEEASAFLYQCSPAYKLEGITNYLASPDPSTLRRLADLEDHTAQLRWFHPEFAPWFEMDGSAHPMTQARWAEEAVEQCLSALLASVMGSRRDEPRVALRSLWFCAMAALNAHRERLDGPLEPAVRVIVDAVREQLSSEKLAVRLEPSDPLHESAPW